MRKVLVVLAGLVAVLAVTAVILFALADPAADVALEVAKATVNLVVAILITGVLSFILTQRNAQQVARDDRAKVLADGLRDLKAGYERVQVARFFLAAHPTGKAFEEQITTFSEARALLHRVQRERFVLGTDVGDQVQFMLDYLTAVTDEYKANYLRITEDRLKEERALERVREGVDKQLAEPAKLQPSLFPRVAALIDDTTWRQDTFHSAYTGAKTQLHDWLNQSMSESDALV